jgi:alkyl hydroperoxide reductase subunit AhpC
MTIRINDIAPDFQAHTTQGKIDFHEWIGNNWCVFVSHPKDFTPICTTELGIMARVNNEFTSRGVKFIGHSIDCVEDHFRWIHDIEETQGVRPEFPIIGDENIVIAKLYEMLPAEAIEGDRTIAQNATVRAVFVIDPSKKIRAMTFYPMSAGRNFDEILRLVDALQLADKYKIATPSNWKAGDAVLIPPSVSNEEANKLFPQGWTTTKPGGGEESQQRPYLRYVVLPKIESDALGENEFQQAIYERESDV